ncbi:SpaH/EbpB family LPXTG-anchored major pilin [Anaerosphaera multitolerans]|uniref:Isopeptide-forming domain-containing fimbrial protein n=1 Tax=Anaerosphaera multitolerans TaxID=2487351 RepID=A0A437S9H0_9FIRM|nr:SpaH/EbpB family LPXTG-anchored major pilin [Anaerosphaera multitolerans]RVU55786.1 isopeptide-forming domain-containing fimbrial protein [Anaerosphaera multitolerans]
MTKKFKSLLGIMMALVMILSAGFGSSKVLAAGGNGEIKVTGTTQDKSYSAYKIFDLTQSGENVSYTIAKEWEDFFTNGAGKDYIIGENTGGKLNPIVVGSETKYINITDENIAEFAKVANAEIKNQTPTKTEKANGTELTFTGLELGYYMIHPEGAASGTDNPNSVISLTTTKPKAEAKVKATYPTVEKTVEEKSYDYGKEIEYTLKGTVPDTKGYKKYVYTMTDTLSEGLTLDTESVKVTVGGEELNENVKLTKEANKLVAEFDMLKLQEKVGKEVKITYKASLNENAVIGSEGNANNVELEYSNNPHDDTTEKTKDSKKVYTGAIKVIKHEEGHEEKLLAGAKFKLKNSEGKFYKLDNNKVTWVTEDQADEKTTGDDGVVEFKGLENGTYYLVETEAPAGFNKLTSPVEVTVDYNNQSTTKYQEAKVANNSGVELPGTGGMGTTLFTILGGGVILIALFSLAKGKVKKERN